LTVKLLDDQKREKEKLPIDFPFSHDEPSPGNGTEKISFKSKLRTATVVGHAQQLFLSNHNLFSLKRCCFGLTVSRTDLLCRELIECGES
jgi:hypothetical protein